VQTIGELFEAIFPLGTTWPEIAALRLKDREDRPPSWDTAPIWPPDVFALTAKLLEVSGAYHHVAPETLAARAEPKQVFRTSLRVSDAQRQEACSLADEWRRILKKRPDRSRLHYPPEKVQERWQRLRTAAGEPILVHYDEAAIPTWWGDALFLFMVADEASRDIGFDPELKPGSTDFKRVVDFFMSLFRFLPRLAGAHERDNFFSCSFADHNVICVLPKSRTPAVGCTLRSLSHNLAAVSPGGEVRVRWNSPFEVERTRESGNLQVLIVPYPYTIEPECFHVVDEAEVQAGVQPWGWFRIEPRWLYPGGDPPSHEQVLARANEFAEFIVSLVKDAESRDSKRPVNMVILPEAALNHMFHYKVTRALMKECPAVEAFISGVTQKRVGDELVEGNFVSHTQFLSAGGSRQIVQTIREKHHRWRLDEPQIEVYGLGRQLTPRVLWWEAIEITSRALDVVALRTGATMSVLICEDLARVDPCQGAVRAIGPSLVVSILMDGSQLATRWPARYATVLAEDPGSAVLTVSSLGLINRTRLSNGSRPAWSIALWRDDRSGPSEILLPIGAHAVSLTLRAARRTEATLDGRQDRQRAVAWTLENDPKDPSRAPRAVTAPNAPEWIVSGTR